MTATWEDLDEEQENAESQSEKEIVTKLCFMVDIVSKEEIKVSDYELEPSFENLQKSYDDLLDDSQLLASHYASLKTFKNYL